MALLPTDFSLAGRTLEEDVYTGNGTFLLAKGTRLTPDQLDSLVKHRIDVVRVCDAYEDVRTSFPPKGSVAEQMERFAMERESMAHYVRAMAQTKALFDKVTEDSIPSLEEFTDAVIPVVKEVLRETSIFRFLYALEGSENYTYRHSLNVGMLSALIAKLLCLQDEEISMVGQAGFLHDVGKVLIPTDILLKPSRLTEEEYEQMKFHTVFGYELINRMEGATEAIAQCALLHHERLNGTGYPLGLTESDIPLLCQIIAVADTFDAICSDRVYKERTSPFVAAQLLWRAACDGHLNAEIVTRFAHYIVSLYAGSKALLNTGDEVEVIFIFKDEPMRPLVRKGEDFYDLRSHRVWDIEKMIG
ncbi:UNVERIFIED_CONTAM: HD-GYP domain-containing protein (c-di-GMP phosphodiesterase class II) [Brevibacillus sp. OAP136]